MMPEGVFSNYFDRLLSFSGGLDLGIGRESPKSAEKYHFEYLSGFSKNSQIVCFVYFPISRFYRVSRVRPNAMLVACPLHTCPGHRGIPDPEVSSSASPTNVK